MRIEAYSLVEFTQKIQEAVIEGYRIDFDDNSSIPVGSFGYYCCKMNKGGKVAALLKAKPEPDPEPIKFPNIDEDIEQITIQEPFKPSIVFEVKTPEPAKKAGRPKAQQV